MDTPSILDDDLLDRIRSRAADYDARNAFCQEDLDELAAAGYLRMFAPADRGGLGLGLFDVAREQRRLASAAPATALAINMHLVWTGVAAFLEARGDSSLSRVLDDAVAGELYAFGISEAGNDLVLFDSTTTAAPLADGAYAFTGTKIFTSLAPAWTRLGVFGRDDTGDEPRLIHGFVTRGTPGCTILDDWDVIGMRASQSRTTVLDGVVVPADRIVRSLPVGPSADPLVLAIFACFETLIASVYTGLAERALDLAVAAAQRRTSRKNDGRPLAADPDVRRRIAAAAVEFDALEPQIDAVARDVDALVDHGAGWFPRLVGIKLRATTTARHVVEAAVQVSGGSAFASGSELSRLYRDVLAGIFHPSTDDSALATVANARLGPLPS